MKRAQFRFKLMIHPDVFFLVGKEAGNLSKHIFVLIVCVYKPQMAGR